MVALIESGDIGGWIGSIILQIELQNDRTEPELIELARSKAYMHVNHRVPVHSRFVRSIDCRQSTVRMSTTKRMD